MAAATSTGDTVAGFEAPIAAAAATEATAHPQLNSYFKDFRTLRA